MATAAGTINTFAKTYRLNWAPANPNAMHPPADLAGHALPCDRCGTIHDPARCDGHARDGEQCGLSRGARTQHLGWGNCSHHGGATPNGVKAARAEQAEHSMFKLASMGEVEAMTDPLGAIAEMAGERRAWADAVITQLNSLRSLTGEDAAGVERLRALVPLAERMSDRAFHAAKVMAELDIDERLVAIQAQATDRVVEQVTAALDRLMAGLQERLGPLLAAGEVWPQAELEELLDGALASVGS
jgi:hypothetical protein